MINIVYFEEVAYGLKELLLKYILFNISVKEKYILLTKKTW